MHRLVPALFLLAAAGCGFEVSLGRGDGIAQIRYEEMIAKSAFREGHTVEVVRDLVVIDPAQSQEYLSRFGPDKIGAIRDVDLALVEARVEGGSFAGGPEVTVAGETLSQPGDSIGLAERYVDALRAGILGGQEVKLPISVKLTVEGGPPDLATWAASIHIVVVLQPTLHVDATKSI